MTPNDAREFWIVFVLLSPLIALYGGAAWLVLLGALAALVYAPMIAVPLLVLWCLRWLIFDFVLALIGGFGLGLGLQGAGFGRRRRPRVRWWAR
jgi:hypothetical protein